MNFRSDGRSENLQNCLPVNLTEREIRIEVQTSVEGPLSFVTTSPKLSASKIYAQVDLNATPQVQVSVNADSLKVISEKLSSADHSKILKAVSDKILKIEQFPKIHFVSTVASIRDSCYPFSVVVMGELTINGTSKEIDLVFKHARDSLMSQISILQSDFNIKPLTGMGGALRCNDKLDLSIQIMLDQWKTKE